MNNTIMTIPKRIAETINKKNLSSSFTNQHLYNAFLGTDIMKKSYKIQKSDVRSYTSAGGAPISTITNITGVKIKNLTIEYFDDAKDKIINDSSWSSVIIRPYSESSDNMNIIVFGDNILMALFLLEEDSELNCEERKFVVKVINNLVDFYKDTLIDKFVEGYITEFIVPCQLKYIVRTTLVASLAYLTLYLTASTGDYFFNIKKLKSTISDTINDIYRLDIHAGAMEILFLDGLERSTVYNDAPFIILDAFAFDSLWFKEDEEPNEQQSDH